MERLVSGFIDGFVPVTDIVVLQVSFGEVTSSCPGKECTEDINQSYDYRYNEMYNCASTNLVF